MTDSHGVNAECAGCGPRGGVTTPPLLWIVSLQPPVCMVLEQVSLFFSIHHSRPVDICLLHMLNTLPCPRLYPADWKKGSYEVRVRPLPS